MKQQVSNVHSVPDKRHSLNGSASANVIYIHNKSGNISNVTIIIQIFKKKLLIKIFNIIFSSNSSITDTFLTVLRHQGHLQQSGARKQRNKLL